MARRRRHGRQGCCADRGRPSATGRRDRRERPREFVDDATVAKRLDRGDPTDAELLRKLLVCVDVHLDELDRTVPAGNRLLEHRRERETGAAPGSPEVHKHRDVRGSLDDGGLEALGGDVHTDTVAAGSCGETTTRLRARAVCR